MTVEASRLEVARRSVPLARRRSPWRWLVLLILGTALGTTAYTAYQRTIAAPAPAPEIVSLPVRRGQITASVSGAGSVVATRQAKLSFLSAGRLKELLVEVGQKVEAGQAIARLDTTQLEIKVEQARSSLRTAQLKLEDLQVGATAEEVAAAQAALQSAQAKLNEVAGGANDADFKAAEQGVVAAQANLDKATADLAKLQAGPSDDDVVAARVALEKAEIAVQKAQADYDRVAWRNDLTASAQAATLQQATLDYLAAQAAYNLKAAPPRAEDVAAAQRAVDTAEASRRAAQAKLDQLRAGPKQADVESAKSTVAAARSQLALKTAGPTATSVAQAQEVVKQAELSLRQAETDLANATLSAPFAGVVAATAANPGEQVGTSTAIATLVDPQAQRVDVNVDEMEVTQIAIGKRATVTFDALPDRRFTGRVIAVAPSATVQQGVVSYAVSLSLDRVQGVTLPAGLTANVSIVVDEKSDVLLVPNRAIRTQGRNRTVQVLVDGKPETRVVRVGMSNDQMSEVQEGLSEGEQVILPTTTTTPARGAGMPMPGGGPVIIPGPGPGGPAAPVRR